MASVSRQGVDDRLGAFALEAHAAVADDHFLLAQNELIERLDALHLRAPLAAGTGHLVLDALEPGAILQHRLEGVAVKSRDGERLKALVDRGDVTGVHDLRDARARWPEHRLAAGAHADLDACLVCAVSTCKHASKRGAIGA